MAGKCCKVAAGRHDFLRPFVISMTNPNVIPGIQMCRYDIAPHCPVSVIPRLDAADDSAVFDDLYRDPHACRALENGDGKFVRPSNRCTKHAVTCVIPAADVRDDFVEYDGLFVPKVCYVVSQSCRKRHRTIVWTVAKSCKKKKSIVQIRIWNCTFKMKLTGRR